MSNQQTAGTNHTRPPGCGRTLSPGPSVPSAEIPAGLVSFSRLATVCLLAATLLTGCGKKPEAPAPEPPKPNGSVDSLLKDPGTQPDAPAAPAATPENTTAVPDQKPDELPDYNTIANAINSYLVKYQRPPKDFEELVAKGFLKKPPPPPPGKKYILNQRFSTLTVVDK